MSNWTKICPKCGVEQSIKEFRYIRRKYSGGPGITSLYAQCHTCYSFKRDKLYKDSYQKKEVKKLTDRYICKNLLKMKLAETPKELIELKRIQLMILREAKK